MSLDDWMAITPVMCHSIDTNGLLISVSDAWLHKLGYSRGEVIGQPSLAFLTHQSREHARNVVFREFFKTGRVENVGYQMVCKDGTVVDVLLSAVLTKETADAPSVSIAIITDITALKTAERKLEDSEGRYRHLVEHQTELVSLARLDGELLFVNSAYARHHHTTPDGMVGRNLLDFVPLSVRDLLAGHLQQLVVSGETSEIENQVVSPDGTVRWMSWTNKALFDAHGVVTSIHSVGKDIDARLDAERRIKDSEARYRLLADNSTDMVFQLDADRCFQYVSPACKDILGYEIAELTGTCLNPLILSVERDSLGEVMQAFETGRLTRHTAVLQFLHRDGHYVWGEMQLRTLGSAEPGKGCETVGTLRDFSMRKQMEDQLREANSRLIAIAATDGLTGLLNRRAFDEALSRELEAALRDDRDLGLILADVDWFKAYNDCYGHLAGDECLQKISAALAAVAGEFAFIVARYGGEEFCIILPGADEGTAFLMAERLRLAVLDLAIRHEATPSQLATVSMGVASLVASRSSSNGTLIAAADLALYDAKALGRNTIARASNHRITACGGQAAPHSGNR